MTHTKALVALLAGLFFTLPQVASAADVAFFPVESTSLSAEDSAAIGELLAQAYANVSGQAVLAPSRVAPPVSAYPEAAKNMGVTEYVRTDAVGIGERVVIHSVRYRADGEALFQTKLTANSMEDVIPVSDRIARSLFERRDDEEVRTRHNVTLTEARRQNRLWSEKVIGFKTGLHQAFAKNADITAGVSGMFDMRLEMDRFFVEFGAGLLLPTRMDDDYYDYGPNCYYDNDGNYICDESGSQPKNNDMQLGGLQAELGGSYFLTDGNIAPYVGGGLIPRITFDENDVTAMLVYGQLGLMLPRDSSTRFYVDARVAQNVLAQHLDNGKRVLPTEISLQAGIGW